MTVTKVILQTIVIVVIVIVNLHNRQHTVKNKTTDNYFNFYWAL
jgi:hypothetical protein